MEKKQKNDQQGKDANVEPNQNSLNDENKNSDSSRKRINTNDSTQIDLPRRKYKYNLN